MTSPTGSARRSLVAYLAVVVAKEGSISHRPADGRIQLLAISATCSPAKMLSLGSEDLRVLAVGFTLCNLLARELTAAALVGRIIPLVVNRGHSHVPAVPDYVHVHPGQIEEISPTTPGVVNGLLSPTIFLFVFLSFSRMR